MSRHATSPAPVFTPDTTPTSAPHADRGTGDAPTPTVVGAAPTPLVVVSTRRDRVETRVFRVAIVVLLLPLFIISTYAGVQYVRLQLAMNQAQAEITELLNQGPAMSAPPLAPLPDSPPFPESPPVSFDVPTDEPSADETDDTSAPSTTDETDAGVAETGDDPCLGPNPAAACASGSSDVASLIENETGTSGESQYDYGCRMGYITENC